MAFLVVALVLVAALCVFQLVLVLAVLRRLREHETRFEQLARSRGPMDAYDPNELVGRRIPELAAHTGGEPRTVGFFSVGCEACHEQAPEFVAAAGVGDASAIVVGAPADELTGLLGGVPVVVTGEEADGLMRAVDVKAFPTFLRVDGDGVIVRAGIAVADLPAATPAL
ncbi:hypothetical protein [Streptomyces solicathayae]|uniref:Thioredoxin domain-containing protein n=1 Tax=Streptomyces solicathayae TaxID=3081768 RepID=A0ABZ0M2L5_9ACTN|nr:hypothetical protein [Streptomyces sp. HUAS YS2]WOX25875.1 hypothetical protein R2D22_32640 [Streptomyces sp. HUAS YS2]